MSLRTDPACRRALVLAAARFGLAGCSGAPSPTHFRLFRAGPAGACTDATLPPAFPPQDIVGRWGLAAYHKDEDRARTEAAAANQCQQPYIITLGPTGGVMMHLADQATPTELRLKGAPGNKTLYRTGRGSTGQPAGPRSGLVRRPRAGAALDRYRSAGPLRHHGLCALRSGRRKAAEAEGRAKRQHDCRKPKAAPKPMQPPIQQTPAGAGDRLTGVAAHARRRAC